MTRIEDSPSWPVLIDRALAMGAAHLREMFIADLHRAQRYSAEACGLTLDYSKQRIDSDVLDSLLELAAERDMSGWIGRLYAGETVNLTEQRAALHMALRAPRGSELSHCAVEGVSDVHAVLDRMTAFSNRVREGHWLGATGQTITDIVNIGIGGSDLGPRMVCEALGAIAEGPRAHYVANVDGAQLAATLKPLDPARTLFVITSKTFTTQETMANAGNARAWLVNRLGVEAVPKHFVAVSTNLAEVSKFGIAPENAFGFWDWVGGRYSVWSAVGLSAMLRLGPDCFRQMLAGAHAMDLHFRDAPAKDNLPILMALLAVWNHNLLGFPSHMVAPYAQRLEKFVSWLQQLEMESNGKSVLRNGQPAERTTPPIWGDVGTNGQHAFFQMIHQGPDIHPVDFILPLAADHDFADQHRILIANCLAQAAALMRGKTADEVRLELSARGVQGETLESAIPHRVFSGNRPSNLLLMPRVDAWHLGALMALYEHRTFALSVLWGINAFDQWGVELGKQLAQRLLRPGAVDDPDLDASTRHHLRHL
ncbi:MAG: glucose-6-phosphate isomerase [Panacagrimonas sp.]